GTVDLTHSMGSNDHLKLYYAYQHDQRGEPILQGNTLPGFGDTRDGKRQIGTLDETHIFGPNLVNEARLGFNRIQISFTPNQQSNGGDVGIKGGGTSGIGLPQINIAGGALNFGGPAGFPQGRTDTTMVLSDTLSYQAGRHAFKFGGEYRSFLNDNFAGDTGTFTFLSVDDFIAGRANGFNVTLGSRPSKVSQKSAGFFVQ